MIVTPCSYADKNLCIANVCAYVNKVLMAVIHYDCIIQIICSYIAVVCTISCCLHSAILQYSVGVNTQLIYF